MSYFITNEQGKNEYGKFDKLRIQLTIPLTCSLISVGFSMICLILLALSSNNTINQAVNNHVLHLYSRQPLLHTVSDKFLSFGLDTSLLRDMKSLPIKDSKFINLARLLGPAYVRVGGTSADCLHFNQTKIVSEKVINPVDGQDISNFTINETDFENLYNFATESKLRMIFDLNVLIRNVNDSWNDVNAKNIISFAKNKGMTLDWQLGNDLVRNNNKISEPNSFHHVFNRNVNATQLAHDYCHLRELLDEIGYNKSLLVGPEVNHVEDTVHMGEQYAKTFLENDKNSVNYVTWHQYYLNGREAQLTDFINISTFNYLPKQIKSMQKAIISSGELIPMWLSETSTAYGGGAPKLSDRFVAGFLWLDKLGYSASTGVNVVTRQSLFGGNYAMIGSDLIPNPDWWVSIVYKKFVSEKVLKLSPIPLEYLRLYAHCTPKKAWTGRVPSITIYGINLANFPVHVTIQGIPVFHRNAKVYLYALTSDKLQSRTIKINGELLKLESNGNLPPFRPIVLEPTEQITLPPYSMIFIIIHNAKVPACYT